MSYDHVIYEKRGHAAYVTLNRPDRMNALDAHSHAELIEIFDDFERDPDAWLAIITGAGDRAFAAGADIVELADQTPGRLRSEGQFGSWDRIGAIGIPLIGAVRGFALGGGCELAMTCDLIVAGDDARFGQPEIRIGVMPGAGGTQRLTRAIGVARAMELVLTGRMIDASEAYAAGLVTSVVPTADVVSAALTLADTVASMPPLAVRAAKRSVLAAAELPLSAGLRAERDAFFDLFATNDQREGMRAFQEKRPPTWTGR